MKVVSRHNRPINFDGFTLVPGVNEVPGDLVPKLEKQYLWGLMVDSGDLEYEKPKPKPPVPKKKKSKKVEF
jgi:hypothetical protein